MWTRMRLSSNDFYALCQSLGLFLRALLQVLLRQYEDRSAMDNNVNLMMVRLPTSISMESLGLLGLLMAWCIQHNLQLHAYWRYGASFRMGGPEVLLYLHPQSRTDHREWVKKLYPVVQVKAVIVVAACKTAGGVEIPVSDALHKFKEELVVEISDRVVTDKALQEMMGCEGYLEAGVQVYVRKSYEDVNELLTEQEDKLEKRRREGKADVDFKDVMTPVEDGWGGMVSVGKDNEDK
ncbi:unnamed protein product [Choristocarpus tenellus]